MLVNKGLTLGLLLYALNLELCAINISPVIKKRPTWIMMCAKIFCCLVQLWFWWSIEIFKRLTFQYTPTYGGITFRHIQESEHAPMMGLQDFHAQTRAWVLFLFSWFFKMFDLPLRSHINLFLCPVISSKFSQLASIFSEGSAIFSSSLPLVKGLPHLLLCYNVSVKRDRR